MSYKKEAHKINVPVSFIQACVLEGRGYAISFYEENDPQNIKGFVKLDNAQLLLWNKFDIGCEDSSNRNEEILYVVNPVGLPKVRSKKSRVRQHAGLVKIQQIAKNSR